MTNDLNDPTLEGGVSSALQQDSVIVEDTDVSEGKVLTQTEAFYEQLKINLQSLLEKKLKDGRLSRKMAAKIMKEVLDTAAVFTADLESKKLPIIGIGRFYIAMTKPRKFPNTRSIYEGLERIPHFRWKPSSRYFSFLLEKLCGVKVPNKETGGEAKDQVLPQ